MEMLSSEADSPVVTDVLSLIEQRSAAAFYQPVISIKKKSVIGLEAVGRGIDPANRRLIEPEALYQLSSQKQKSLDLDRLFRLKGLEGFAEIQSKIPGLILFLGLETSVLTKEIVGSGHLLGVIRDLNLEPNSIAVELSMSEAWDPEAAKLFTENYRANDLLISLKDVDTSRECLDRILRLSPDVFKLDPAMTLNLSKDSYKRDGFKTLTGLSHRLGSLVVANGVENEEDALVALELGADMLQGSYFSKPQRTETSTTLGLKARIVFVASRFKRLMTEKVGRDKDRKNRYEKIASEIFAMVGESPLEKAGQDFPDYLKNYSQLECLYLLDQDGVQVTETACNFQKVSGRKKYLFQPAPKGTDHSLKDYYYSLVYNGLERYFTEPYISLASGNLCVTASGILKSAEDGKPYVLCMDIDVTKI